MTTATIEATPQDMPMPADMIELPDAPAADPLSDEIRIGFEELRQMSPEALRGVISRRVEMLENELRDRETRRAALDTAQLASKIIEVRHDRSMRIKRKVNYGSYIAALASTFLIVAVMV